VIYGVAIQANPDKVGLLRALEVIKKATISIWGWVVKLTPLGVFALFADLAGTVRFHLLGSLLVYLVLFFGAALILTFWILPTILASFLPLRRGEILGELRSALLIAVATSLPITAVPIIVQWAERVIVELAGREKDDDAVVSTTVAVGYPLAQLGNLFVFLFMAFAAVFFHNALHGAEWLGLPVLTVLSTAGTPVATVDAVAFLAQWLGLPTDAQLLYVEMMTLTRYPQVLVSVVGIAFVSILIPAFYYGVVRVRPVPLAGALVGGLGLLGVLAGSGRMLETRLTQAKTNPYRDFTLGAALTRPVRATVAAASPAATPAAQPVMDRIRSSGKLRVGYAPHVIPFSYFNQHGDLVGYDIAFLYALARDLNVDLEFAPFSDWAKLDDDLRAGRFDLAVGGIFLTAERLQQTTVSKPYRQSPLALIVRTADADRFFDGKALRSDTSLRVAAFSSDILVPLARSLFPKADVRVVANYEALLTDPSLDAALWTLDQARAWAASHPGFSAVVPSDFGTPFLMAYLMPPDAREFAVLVDEWLEIQRFNGFQQAMENYWVEGKPREAEGPRWSILHNVLGWGR
jgi:proton glutamate symport protein